MSKMRVYELAKELGRDNKEIMGYLASNGVEVTSHMTMLDDQQVQMVRQNVPVRPAAPKPVQPKTQPAENGEGGTQAEAPKKKNISRVFRSQNSKTGIQRPAGMRHVASHANGNRPAGQRPAAGQQTRPAAQAPVKPAEAAKPAETAKTAETAKPAETVKVTETVKAAEVSVKPAETSVKQTETPKPVEAVKTVETPKTTETTKSQETAKQTQGQRNSDRPQRQDRSNGERDNNRGDRENRGGERRNFGDRDNRNGERRNSGDRDNRGGERRNFGDRDNRNGERRNSGDRDNRGGERRSFGDRDNRNGERRNFGDRDNRNGERRNFGDRDNRNGERRSFGDKDRNSGDRDRVFDKDRDSRSQGDRRNNSRNMGGSQGDLASKPVTKESRIRADKEKDKDKYNKHDKYDRQEREQGRPGQKNNASKNDKKAGKFIKPVKPVEPVAEKKEDEIKNIVLPDKMTIRELADALKIQAAAIVKKLFLQGTMVTVNHEIDFEMAEEIALEYNCIAEREEKVDVIEELLKEEEDSEDTMITRPPVVCVMGHVDHGKTSLLDAIRNTHVIAKEAGGITQHIGAYMVSVDGQQITFLDTPGHEAFTAMRMRGANATDIAILVVAADDGVMPQTVEAISHAKAAGTEIIVAINKIDKPSANIDRVKQELSEYELIPEDWGGNTVMVPVSAHSHEGLDNLLEMILLTAEVAELKANPNRKARGLVIEAQLDKGKGPVATVLVQKGTLRVGDAIAAGACHGKVRAMMDDKGRRVKEAGPSTPVEILGLSDVPNAGEVFVVCDNDKEARNFAETFISQNKEKLLEETKARMSLDDLFTQIQAGNLKELNIIVKADVQGSVEAVKQSLQKLSNEEVVVKIIHGGVGAINESDVSLASASNAIIIGFNVRPDASAKGTAERENVDIRLYRVIYDAIADVEAAMKGMLDPVFEEKVIGHAEVRQTFKASGVGTIAGSYILDGTFQRNCSCRITREGVQIFDGALASLKRFKDDVKEVRAGYECGLVFEKFNDIKEFDQVEAYIMVEVPR